MMHMFNLLVFSTNILKEFVSTIFVVSLRPTHDINKTHSHKIVFMITKIINYNIC